MAKYRRLQLDERKFIAHFHKEGYSIRKIARLLKRPPSTLSRELRRNNYVDKTAAERAHDKALKSQAARRKAKSKILSDPKLHSYVLVRLGFSCSPSRIAQGVHKELGLSVSQSTIYNFRHAGPQTRLTVLRQKLAALKETWPEWYASGKLAQVCTALVEVLLTSKTNNIALAQDKLKACERKHERDLKHLDCSVLGHGARGESNLSRTEALEWYLYLAYFDTYGIMVILNSQST